MTNSFNKEKLKIAILSYRSHPYCGGQGIYVKYLSFFLHQLGHEVDVISSAPYPELLSADINLIKVPSLQIFDSIKTPRFKLNYLLKYTDLFDWLSKLSGGFSEPYTFSLKVKKLLKNHQYDLIHDNQTLGYGLLSLQKNTSIPLITTIHHPVIIDKKIAIQSEKRLLYRILIKRWYFFCHMQKKVARQLKHILTVSHTSQNDIIKEFNLSKNQVTVIHNAVDTNTFRPLPNKTRQPYQLLTTASSYQPLKGLKFLIEALPFIREHYPNVSLTIIGKQQEPPEIKKFIEANHLSSAISFRSNLSESDICELYAEHHLAIIPSLHEGFGLPAAEAMACGIPIIATNIDVLQEVLDDCALFVPTKNAQAIGEATIKLFEDLDYCNTLSTKGRQRVIKHFNWATQAHEINQYYNNLLNTYTTNH